eukprot:scaffold1300_cov235-Pinguiococcus_pyrenoidosus.AAC.3
MLHRDSDGIVGRLHWERQRVQREARAREAGACGGVGSIGKQILQDGAGLQDGLRAEENSQLRHEAPLVVLVNHIAAVDAGEQRLPQLVDALLRDVVRQRPLANLLLRPPHVLGEILQVDVVDV